MSYNINLIKSFTQDSGLTLKGVGLLQVQMGSSTTMRNELVEILKIKCPYSARDTTPVQAAEKLPSFFCKVVNGNLSLKKITTTISKCKASLQSLMQTGVIFVCIHHMVSLLSASHLTSHFGKVLYTN